MPESAAPHTATAPISGDQAVLAGRYAGALYDLAAQENSIDAVTADLRSLRRLWDECPEWRSVACDPRLMLAEIVAATEDVIKISGLSKLVGNFVAVTAQNRRLSALPQIIENFMDIAAAHRGEFRAEIRAARPLSTAQRDALAASLTAASGGKVHLTVIEDAALIGGLTVKMGSKLIDASVKTKLDILERQLLKGVA